MREKKRVGLYISAREVMAVEYRLSRGMPQIRRLGVRARHTGELMELPALLRSLWDEDRFSTRYVHVCIEDLNAQYYHYDLPKMPIWELEQVLKRKIETTYKGDAGAIIYDHRIITRYRDGASEHHRVMLTAARRSDIDRYISILTEAGLTAVQIISEPIARLNGLAQCCRADDAGSAMLVYLGESKTEIIITANCELQFSRELPIGMDQLWQSNQSGGGSPSLSVAPLVTELERSLRFYYQRYRDATVSRLYLNGSRNIEDVRAALLARLGLPVELLYAAAALDLSGLEPEQVEILKQDESRLWISLGLSEPITPAAAINLVPVEHRRRGLRLLQRATAVAAVMAMLILIAWLYMQLWTTGDGYAALVKELQKASSAKDRLEYIQTIETRRREHEKRLDLLGNPEIGSVSWIEWLRQLSLVVPDDLTFQTFEITSDAGTTWQLHIAGVIVSQDYADGADALQKFTERFRGLPFISNVQEEPLSVKENEQKDKKVFTIRFGLIGELIPLIEDEGKV